MNIRHLRIFKTVCKENSFTKAAERLFITQPAVSNTINELEKFNPFYRTTILGKDINPNDIYKDQANIMDSVVNEYDKNKGDIMRVDKINIKINNHILVLRNPEEEDAEILVEYLKTVCNETRFLVMEPEEIAITPEEERNFIKSQNESERSLKVFKNH